MKSVSAEEGIVSLGYDVHKYAQFSRLYQIAKLFLYAPSSGLYSCPLAMTDGAAKSIKVSRSKSQNQCMQHTYIKSKMQKICLGPRNHSIEFCI